MKRPIKKRQHAFPGMQSFLQQCETDAIALKTLHKEIRAMDKRLRALEEDRVVDDATRRLQGEGAQDDNE